ncbi:MAG: zinc-ribbon domain-containing protein [Planctomycetota bacterium]
MRTQCPHCRAKFHARDEHEGKKVKCPEGSYAKN